MNSRRRGLISFIIMCVLALLLVLGSERVYETLKSWTAPKGTAYEITTDGFGGSVVVQTILEDGSITAVEVLDCSSETAEIGQAAAPQVAEAIVEAQSLDVDGVSGATITSKAIKGAVEEALVKAGLDLTLYKTETEEEQEEETAEAAETEAAETEAAGNYAAGEYTAAVKGYGGDVAVSVIIAENGTIEAVKILDYKDESEDVGQKAALELTKEILLKQSADVDDVSGATLTSTAVKEAVNACLGQASK